VAQAPAKSHGAPTPARDGYGLPSSGDRHDTAVQRLADQVVLRLADRLHPEPGHLRDLVTLNAFVAALLDGDDTLSLTMARAVMDGQASRKTVYFGTLAPAALRLGDMWERDEISFLQLSMASGRIFSILRTLRRELAGRASPLRGGALALFGSVPGEEHTLGVTMAADLFREAGWQVDLRAGVTHDILIAAAESSPYAVIGLSAGHPSSVPALTRLVGALRQAAPLARILLAGHVVDMMPGLGRISGVDLATTDFDTMLAAAEGYLPA
jgi:MerR family transcriptional regulator, light-induced transcriptional regulator